VAAKINLSCAAWGSIWHAQGSEPAGSGCEQRVSLWLSAVYIQLVCAKSLVVTLGYLIAS
jgi:hypothetical protein